MPEKKHFLGFRVCGGLWEKEKGFRVCRKTETVF